MVDENSKKILILYQRERERERERDFNKYRLC